MDAIVVTVLLLPMFVLTHIAIRLMIGSDHEIRSQKIDHIPVTIENKRRKKDPQ